jgi:hypothetical protein
MQKRNQSSGCFLLSVVCGDMQVHAVVMCVQGKPAKHSNIPLTYRRRYPCASSVALDAMPLGGSLLLCKVAVDPEQRSVHRQHARIPRDVDMMYLPNCAAGQIALIRKSLRNEW